jgi:hypothetical protein
MNRLLLTTAAFALLTTTAQAANYTTMFASNYWRVTHMERNNDGNPMCMMQSQISFGNSVTGWVMIKWTKGQLNPFIHLSKTNWHFPSDVQVPISVNLDRREFTSVSRNQTTSKYSHLIAYVMKEEGDGWLEAFASSDAMTITFRRGNEKQWSVKMAGSRDASKSFRSCLKLLESGKSPAPDVTSPVPDISDDTQPVPIKPMPTKKPKGDHI